MSWSSLVLGALDVVAHVLVISGFRTLGVVGLVLVLSDSLPLGVVSCVVVFSGPGTKVSCELVFSAYLSGPCWTCDSS